jgi:hypothetical protein
MTTEPQDHFCEAEFDPFAEAEAGVETDDDGGERVMLVRVIRARHHGWWEAHDLSATALLHILWSQPPVDPGFHSGPLLAGDWASSVALSVDRDLPRGLFLADDLGICGAGLQEPVLWIVETDRPCGWLSVEVNPEGFLDAFWLDATENRGQLASYFDELIEQLFPNGRRPEEKSSCRRWG